MKNSKPIQTLQELTQNLRADCYYFVSMHSAGDTYYLCSLKSALEQKLQGKIILIIKPSHKAVVEIFAYEDYIICENSIITKFHKTPQCFEIDSVVSTPTLGKLFPAHATILQRDIRSVSLLNWNLQGLDLPLDTKGDLPTNLPKISESLRAKLDKIAPLKQIILFCPEANSCECLPPIIFKYECDRLLRQGYKIIVNCGFVSSVHNFKSIDYTKHLMYGVYNLNLSLKDTIALALSCAGVISTRSGFCDIIAPHCENLTIYYTNFYYWWQGNLKEINAKHLPKEVLIYDEPIYKRYLRAIRESLPIRLYKRYATKGFLRKLRLPFTAYFKIYRRHKNGALQDFGATNLAHGDFSDKEMSEFIEQELIQTYEYNLGVALQRACERFWWGGFLLFPFAYLKIRKEKGKRFMRMSEIL